ncbi:hypothetical protein E2C01_067810 [Portunus trituberculatus]|uniref:Uncharacterized protein n=1 Tax=Portunus trituberculatus TaxID=210409 RepID=A0A5B7HUP1_PORTR|nr:hypothetical protein [Portunus trituberculatus]
MFLFTSVFKIRGYGTVLWLYPREKELVTTKIWSFQGPETPVLVRGVVRCAVARNVRVDGGVAACSYSVCRERDIIRIHLEYRPLAHYGTQVLNSGHRAGSCYHERSAIVMSPRQTSCCSPYDSCYNSPSLPASRLCPSYTPGHLCATVAPSSSQPRYRWIISVSKSGQLGRDN